MAAGSARSGSGPNQRAATPPRIEAFSSSPSQESPDIAHRLVEGAPQRVVRAEDDPVDSYGVDRASQSRRPQGVAVQPHAVVKVVQQIVLRASDNEVDRSLRQEWDRPAELRHDHVQVRHPVECPTEDQSQGRCREIRHHPDDRGDGEVLVQGPRRDWRCRVKHGGHPQFGQLRVDRVEPSLVDRIRQVDAIDEAASHERIRGQPLELGHGLRDVGNGSVAETRKRPGYRSAASTRPSLIPAASSAARPAGSIASHVGCVESTWTSTPAASMVATRSSSTRHIRSLGSSFRTASSMNPIAGCSSASATSAD